MALIYDTFIFFNELDLLEIRLNVLDKHVDYFVLVEASETFQGAPKPLYFAENKERFSKFLHKIVHITVEDMPASLDPFDREYFQRDCILRGLKDCQPEDLIILSDVDEIPDPKKIPASFFSNTQYLFSQSLYYYKLNRRCLEIERLPCSVILNFANLGVPSQLRKEIVGLHSNMLAGQPLSDRFKLIEEGGWHFSYLGSAEMIVKKIEAFAHVEYNSAEYKDFDSLVSCISQGRDLFGRDLTFVNTAIAELPAYVRDNRERYEAMNYLEAEAYCADLSVLHNTHDILFDQYSRYRACAELLQRLGATAASRILDVGSGSACLLSDFLPGYDISYVDPLINALPSKKSNQFGYQIDEVADKLGLFDYVVAIDVLEHVPPQFRDGFTSTLASLATKSIVLAFPYDDEGSPIGVDRAVNADYAFINKHSYSWLKEHEEYGLPNANKLKSALISSGLDTDYFHHGYAPWLEVLLSYVINVNDIPSVKMLGHEVSKEFNQKLFGYDFNQPAYRVFLVAAKSTLPEGWKPTPKPVDTHAERIFKNIMHEAYLRLVGKLQIGEQKSSAAELEHFKALAERDAKLDEANKLILQMRSSSSWRLTMPLRFAVRLLRHGLANEDRQRIAQVLRKQYHQLPLPLAVKKLVGFVYHRVFWRGIGLIRRLIISKGRFTSPSIAPVLQGYNSPDYLVWGVVDWHFRHQRPQQLALAVAKKGRRVFYISPALVDEERAGFDVEALDASGQLFQVKLFAKGAPSIYADAPSQHTVAQLRRSIGEVLAWAGCKQIVSLVDHPFWYNTAAVLPNCRMVYDCMDYHEGFGNNAESLMRLEKRLLSEAELTIATSAWLNDAIAPLAKHRALIRNAGEYEHFAKVPESIYIDPQGRRVIGYYGAIAEWFDIDLVEAVALQNPDCSVLLIGADTVNSKSKLAKLHNVTFTGEVPYSELPYYLHGFDVCLLPFKVIPLTLATNPVKAYEYLGAGKPIVTVALPEMVQFDGLVYVADSKETFLKAICKVLSQPEPAYLIQQRKAFAAEQTWQHRAEALIQQVESATRDVKVSVIVVTYNNLELTRACLESLDEYSQYEPIEIIVVDNASSDGSPTFLSEWGANGPNRRLILNEDNKGFAAANNQGLANASGEYLVLLNNDTYVTPGWIRTLVRHLQRDNSIGLIGPVTNNIGNEAKIDIAYGSMEEMLQKSSAYTRRHIGQTYPLKTAAFFCVMLTRSTYERVGALDEAFGRGFFEDDDYCRRVEKVGLRVVCAEDVFIHHHLSASFNKLKQHDRQKLFEDNKKIYEAKWGAWVPHAYRSKMSALDVLPAAAEFEEHKFTKGICNICGHQTRFFFKDLALYRETLNCEHCRSTSRYRSIARGVLQAIEQQCGIRADSLAGLAAFKSSKRLVVYDTQPPFYYAPCAYPIPDLLKKTGWIDVEVSQYKPNKKLGITLDSGITNQNLECLTFADSSIDIVITSDVMEHVRLDKQAHHEIMRVLKPEGVYVFTVPHDRSREETLVRVQVTDPADSSKDVHLLEPEYHGDTNSDEGGGVLSYRVYGTELDKHLASLGFDVEYSKEELAASGIMNTELFYCRKLNA
jgi:GT2 family glycosyltransferase/2-polyprenyl-3-methyl-5-hydroxy-6-metoxy-1,4-benzoquinol methylase